MGEIIEGTFVRVEDTEPGDDPDEALTNDALNLYDAAISHGRAHFWTAIEYADVLLRLKKRIDHGGWSDFLLEHNIKARTVERWMFIASHRDYWPEAESANLADLGLVGLEAYIRGEIKARLPTGFRKSRSARRNRSTRPYLLSQLYRAWDQLWASAQPLDNGEQEQLVEYIAEQIERAEVCQ